MLCLLEIHESNNFLRVQNTSEWFLNFDPPSNAPRPARQKCCLLLPPEKFCNYKYKKARKKWMHSIQNDWWNLARYNRKGVRKWCMKSLPPVSVHELLMQYWDIVKLEKSSEEVSRIYCSHVVHVDSRPALAWIPLKYWSSTITRISNTKELRKATNITS